MTVGTVALSMLRCAHFRRIKVSGRFVDTPFLELNSNNNCDNSNNIVSNEYTYSGFHIHDVDVLPDDGEECGREEFAAESEITSYFILFVLSQVHCTATLRQL